MNDIQLYDFYNKLKSKYESSMQFNGISFDEIETAFTCFVWSKYYYTDNIKLVRLFHKHGFKVSRCGREYWEVKNA